METKDIDNHNGKTNAENDNKTKIEAYESMVKAYKKSASDLRWALGIMIVLFITLGGFLFFKNSQEYRRAVEDAREASKQASLWESRARDTFKSIDEEVKKRLTEIGKDRKLGYLWIGVLSGLSSRNPKHALKAIEEIAELDPESYYVYEVWGQALLSYANIAGRTDKEKEKVLIIQAEPICLKAESIKEGSGAYYLACIRLFNGDENACEKWLKLSEETGNLPTLEYAKRDKYLESVRDKQWFKDIQWDQN